MLYTQEEKNGKKERITVTIRQLSRANVSFHPINSSHTNETNESRALCKEGGHFARKIPTHFIQKGESHWVKLTGVCSKYPKYKLKL